jgi:hypothetical protein
MTRIELAIKALEDLPEDRREEIADLVLDVIATHHGGGSALTEEQWAEIDRRRARGFRPADPKRIDRLIERLK